LSSCSTYCAHWMKILHNEALHRSVCLLIPNLHLQDN
jgi:hypothetical protein